jgi:hypothetical protein
LRSISPRRTASTSACSTDRARVSQRTWTG